MNIEIKCPVNVSGLSWKVYLAKIHQYDLMSLGADKKRLKHKLQRSNEF